jgi:hypothetical protein
MGSPLRDYSALTQGMELDAGIRTLPPELGNGTGFMLHWNNHSDDLFAFISKKLTQTDGIRPLTWYAIDYKIRFASNAGAGCSGIGGSPGESVYLKAGGMREQPIVHSDLSGFFTVNISKGNQSSGGADMSVAGDIAVPGNPCSGDAPFVSIERLHRHSGYVQANANGELWLLVGTDSGFEGRTTIYYQSIDATLTATPLR